MRAGNSPLRPPAVLLAPLLALAGCGDARRSEPDRATPPTFAGEVAAIVSAHCGDCHRADGSAPFSLHSYAQVSKRAKDILAATETGYMPPWLPQRTGIKFAGERGLSEAEIDALRRWVDAGAPAGDLAAAPKVQVRAEGWQLSEPDLVLTLDEAFSLPPDGADVFRSFVLRVEGLGGRWVRAVEIRPQNPRAVHHAWLTVDESDSCRRLDAADPGPGFAGMETGLSRSPDGHLLGWTPGKAPHPGSPGMAWRLADGMDLVLQLHMLPTGKPERVQPLIGLHFTAEPPTKHPFAMVLKVAEIDIPADEAHYVTEQSIELPVAVDLLSIYPHAHYVCREMLVKAQPPGGGELTLLEIGDWDFNWQDQYVLAEPLQLAPGTRISMRYVYDNSAANPRNPWSPPRRIVLGDRSSDEMGSLALQLLPASRADYDRLEEASHQHAAEKLGGYRNFYNYANSLQKRNAHADAIAQYRKAIHLEPGRAVLHHNLAGSLAAIGNTDAAIATIREAIRLDPLYADAHLNLGNFLVKRNALREALQSYARALEIDPDQARARQNFEALREHLAEDLPASGDTPDEPDWPSNSGRNPD